MPCIDTQRICAPLRMLHLGCCIAIIQEHKLDLCCHLHGVACPPPCLPIQLALLSSNNYEQHDEGNVEITADTIVILRILHNLVVGVTAAKTQSQVRATLRATTSAHLFLAIDWSRHLCLGPASANIHTLAECFGL